MMGAREDRWVHVAAFFVYKVSIQKDILGNPLKSGDIVAEDRQEVQQELDLVNKRWGSGRSQDVVD